MSIVLPAKFYRDPANAFQAFDAYENSCQGCDHDIVEREKLPFDRVHVSTRCRMCQKVYPKGTAQTCLYWTKRRGWE